MLLEETPAVLSLGKTLRRTWVQVLLEKRSKSTSHQKSNYVPFVVPGISASSSSTTPSSASSPSSSQESTSAYRVSVSENRGVEAPVSERSGSTNVELRGNPLHESTETEKMRNAKKYKEIYLMNCLIGYRNSERIWLIKVLQKSLGETQSKEVKTLPSHLVNLHWSREQKWNQVRVSIVYIRTFRRTEHGLVDESVPEHRDISSSSHELPSEPRSNVVSGKHSIYTYFPKGPDCDICLRTKITRASCRRRTGTVEPRAEHVGDFVTADHKVLGEGCESRNNHRYAVVVQDLATQWLQSYPCKTKTSQDTQKLTGADKETKIYTDNSLEFGKVCEDLSWNYCTSTPHRTETNGIAERAVRRVKEGTSAVQ